LGLGGLRGCPRRHRHRWVSCVRRTGLLLALCVVALRVIALRVVVALLVVALLDVVLIAARVRVARRGRWRRLLASGTPFIAAGRFSTSAGGTGGCWRQWRGAGVARDAGSRRAAGRARARTGDGVATLRTSGLPWSDASTRAAPRHIGDKHRGSGPAGPTAAGPAPAGSAAPGSAAREHCRHRCGGKRKGARAEVEEAASRALRAVRQRRRAGIRAAASAQYAGPSTEARVASEQQGGCGGARK
jgi:hypothetical protein